MRIYARPGALLAKQIIADCGLIAMGVLLLFFWHLIHDALVVFAMPAQSIADTTGGLSSRLSSAADNVGGVVAIGEQLRAPFDYLATGLGDISTNALLIVGLVDAAAVVVATVACAVPLAIYLWKWLPFRIGFAHRTWSARGLLPAEHAPELFALRALAGLPLGELAKVSNDPMGAWLRGDQRVIRSLADMALRRDGLRLPTRTD